MSLLQTVSAEERQYRDASILLRAVRFILPGNRRINPQCVLAKVGSRDLASTSSPAHAPGDFLNDCI